MQAVTLLLILFSRTRHEHPGLHQAAIGHVRQKTGKDERSRQNHERCVFSIVVVCIRSVLADDDERVPCVVKSF